MTPTDPPTDRPYLTDKVHAALVKAGRPLTRNEIREYYLTAPAITRTADVQAALDTLVAEGLATKGEERLRWQRFDLWRATGEKG